MEEMLLFCSMFDTAKTYENSYHVFFFAYSWYYCTVVMPLFLILIVKEVAEEVMLLLTLRSLMFIPSLALFQSFLPEQCHGAQAQNFYSWRQL